MVLGSVNKGILNSGCVTDEWWVAFLFWKLIFSLLHVFCNFDMSFSSNTLLRGALCY